MKLEEKIDIVTSLLPDSWSIYEIDDGLKISNGSNKISVLFQDDSVVIGQRSFSYVDFEASVPLLVSFIYECLDGEKRM